MIGGVAPETIASTRSVTGRVVGFAATITSVEGTLERADAKAHRRLNTGEAATVADAAVVNTLCAATTGWSEWTRTQNPVFAGTRDMRSMLTTEWSGTCTDCGVSFASPSRTTSTTTVAWLSPGLATTSASVPPTTTPAGRYQSTA